MGACGVSEPALTAQQMLDLLRDARELGAAVLERSTTPIGDE